MAKFCVLIYKSNQKIDGSFPVCLRITKDGKRKYSDLGLTAKEEQWNEETARFKKDKYVQWKEFIMEPQIRSLQAVINNMLKTYRPSQTTEDQ